MNENLILENQNLIYGLMKFYSFYPNKEDLFQAGRLGMLEAYTKYNPNLNIKFTTFAYKYILGEMRKLIREDKTLKINRNLQALNSKIEKASMYLSQQLGYFPSNKDIAQFLEIPEELVIEALNTPKTIHSLDEPLTSNGKEINLLDTISIEEKNKDELMMLKTELENLSPSEQELILKRYYEGYTQQETAEMLGKSQVQVYRQEQKVFKKLKDRMLI